MFYKYKTGKNQISQGLADVCMPLHNLSNFCALTSDEKRSVDRNMALCLERTLLIFHR
jgi:hypothetical protein